MSNLRPFGHHTVTASFVVPEAGSVIAFLEKTFGARVVDRYEGPGGSVMHAELLIRDTALTCGEPMMGFEAMPGTFSVYVDSEQEVEATYRRALEHGAQSLSPPRTEPWGYRSASVRDGGGNRWTICCVAEIVPREEIERRMAEMMKG